MLCLCCVPCWHFQLNMPPLSWFAGYTCVCVCGWEGRCAHWQGGVMRRIRAGRGGRASPLATVMKLGAAISSTQCEFGVSNFRCFFILWSVSEGPALSSVLGALHTLFAQWSQNGFAEATAQGSFIIYRTNQ